MSPRARGTLLLIITAAIWGFAFVAQRVGADHMGPFAFNGVRFALGTLSLLPVIALFDHLRRRAGEPVDGAARTRAALLPGLAAGVILFTASWLQQWGLGHTTAGKAGFITGLYMVFVPILGLLFGHRTAVTTWIGVSLGLAGLYVLSVHGGFAIQLGDAIVLAGAVLWAGHILVVDRFTDLDVLRFSAVQFVTTTVLSLVAAVLLEPEPFAGTGAALIPILYGGLLSVGVAYTFQVFGQRDAAPSAAAIILSTESVFAAVGGILVLGEPLTWRELTGFTLMLAGILVSQWTPGGSDPADTPVEPFGHLADDPDRRARH